MTHVPLSYAAMDASRTMFSREVLSEGAITALMCESCSRVFLYGVPWKKEDGE